MIWQTTRFDVDLSVPRVMGIVNVTPDSFFDGGASASEQDAVARCRQLVAEGAELLDIGGESTRPRALPVPLQVELDRVLPVIEAALQLGVPVSVDTRTAAVMQAALSVGVDIVNDIQALRGAGAVDTVVAHPRCGVCLMHMQGDPATMQVRPTYADVVHEVGGFLSDRVAALGEQGVDAARIVVDPGIGFGKTPAHNLELLQRQAELLSIGRPLLVGWSRKSSLGVITGRPASDRLAASLAAAVMAVERGARIVRVHDVGPTVDALAFWKAAAGRVDNSGADNCDRT
jgi:dihydropteroate synthase